MNACKQIADIIGPYLYGQATQREVEMLEEHLRSCKCCAWDVNQRRQVIAALVQETPTRVERERIMRGVRTRIAADSARAESGRMNRVLRLSGAVAMAVMLFIAGMWTGQRNAADRPAVSTAKMVTSHVKQSVCPLMAHSIQTQEHRTSPESNHSPRRHRLVLSANYGRADARRLQANRSRAKAADRSKRPDTRAVPREEYVEVALHPRQEVAHVPVGVDDASVASAEESIMPSGGATMNGNGY
jgi:predicted phage tail protein